MRNRNIVHNTISVRIILLFIWIFSLSGCSLVIAREITSSQLFSGGGDLSVGISRADITPGEEILNWVTGEPYGIVLDSLYVRSLVLGDGENKVVIISWDLVDAGESATDEVRKAISSELNIPFDHILVNATHTHSAPWSPVYSKGYRGDERDTFWALRHMPPQNNEPHFRKWMTYLLSQTVEATRNAVSSMQPATLWIGRADVGEYLNNRRPRIPSWGIEESMQPNNFNYLHEEWNPDVVTGGASFGPVDRTLTLLTFRDQTDRIIASVFHMSCHAVSIYPFLDGISGDWPAEAIFQIRNNLGGETLFLQGTGGDINPWRRGRKAVNEMGSALGERAVAAARYSARLESGKISVNRAVAGLPLSEVGKERTGLHAVNAEVQVITYGPLALVTLPGEPLTDLGREIRKRSPYPQTLVLGYSNGNGVHYAGMPGEKARGGYEMTTGTVGADEAGLILVEMAVRLLTEMATLE